MTETSITTTSFSRTSFSFEMSSHKIMKRYDCHTMKLLRSTIAFLVLGLFAFQSTSGRLHGNAGRELSSYCAGTPDRNRCLSFSWKCNPCSKNKSICTRVRNTCRSACARQKCRCVEIREKCGPGVKVATNKYRSVIPQTSFLLHTGSEKLTLFFLFLFTDAPVLL